MIRPDLRLVGAAFAAVAAAWLTLAPSPEEGATPGPFVPKAVLVEALGTSVPVRPTRSDDIDHFEARLASRGEEALSHQRLLGSYLLRFRAYGDVRDLEAAEAHLASLRRSGLSARTLTGLESSMHLVQHEFSASLSSARRSYLLSSPRDEGALYRLFDALWATGASAEARKVLARGADTSSVAYLSREARVLDSRGDVKRARDRFRRVVQLVDAYAEPASVRAWARVESGHFELHSGDAAAAVARYRDALELLPGSPAALEGLAQVAYGVDGDLDAAAALYTRALELGAHLDLMPRLATVLRENGQEEEARATEADFVRRATEDALHMRWFRRPLALLFAEHEATACDALSLALDDLAERRDSGSWGTLAWARFRTGDVEGAAADARRAVAGGTPEPWVALRTGAIALAVGERREATRRLRVAEAGAAELTHAQTAELDRLLAGESAARPPTLSCEVPGATPSSASVS